jgi:hypothetical protein
MTNRIIFVFGVMFVFMVCAYNGQTCSTNGTSEVLLDLARVREYITPTWAIKTGIKVPLALLYRARVVYW